MTLPKTARVLFLALLLGGAAVALGMTVVADALGIHQAGKAQSALAAALPSERDQVEGQPALLGDAAAGKLTFTMWCASCHGPGGSAGTLEEISESPSVFDGAAFTSLVREGDAHNPPGPYQSFQISDRSVDDLYAYVASFAPEGRTAGTGTGPVSPPPGRTGQPSLLVSDILARASASTQTLDSTTIEVKGDLSLLPFGPRGSTPGAVLRIESAPDGSRRQVLTNADDEDHEAVIVGGDLYLQGPLAKRTYPDAADRTFKLEVGPVAIRTFGSPLLEHFAFDAFDPIDVITDEQRSLRISRIGTLNDDGRSCEVWRTMAPEDPVEITLALTAANDLCHVGFQDRRSKERRLAVLVRGFDGATITPPEPGTWNRAALEQSCWPDPAFRLDPMRDSSGEFRQVPRFAGPPNEILDPMGRYTAVVETSIGTFRILLDAAERPIAVNNFVCLATYGFYDGLDFAWADADWIIVGGDPVNTSRGGPGYEVEAEPSDGTYPRATVAMSATRASEIGSQFFVVLNDWEMDRSYPIIGKVISGWDVVKEIAKQPAGEAAESPIPTLVEPVEIISIEIELE